MWRTSRRLGRSFVAVHAPFHHFCPRPILEMRVDATTSQFGNHGWRGLRLVIPSTLKMGNFDGTQAGQAGQAPSTADIITMLLGPSRFGGNASIRVVSPRYGSPDIDNGYRYVACPDYAFVSESRSPGPVPTKLGSQTPRARSLAGCQRRSSHLRPRAPALL
jgi:hypothetical protein